MKRSISVRVKGHLGLLFEHWPLPQGVGYTVKAADHALLRFEEGILDGFDALERVVETLDGAVRITPRFQACFFNEEDCAQAKLLAFTLRCTRGLDLNEPPSDVPSLQSRAAVTFLAERPPEGWILLTCCNLTLFHKSFVETLRQRDLALGLFCLPAQIVVSGADINEEWLWVSSRSDLGVPLLERRFLKAFMQERWHEEDFCSSSFYDGKLLFVSQPVAQLIRNMPACRCLEPSFEPVDLLKGGV